jgi:hypothetical protein
MAMSLTIGAWMKLPIIFLIVSFCSILVLGCSSDNSTSAGLTSSSPAGSSSTSLTAAKTPNNTASNPAQYLMLVFSGDKQIAVLQMADLQKLKSVQIQTAGRQEEGPALSSVLSLVGVMDFSQITFYGYARGRLATAELTLQKSQIKDQVVFSYSNQNTVKICGVNIPFDNWVIDVNKMVIK